MNEIALVYDQKGNFRGYTILKFNKLGSTNLWPEGEIEDLKQQIARLNDDSNIKQFWPNTRDPDVQALLNDPNFLPYDTVDEQVMDDANSYLVYDESTRTEYDSPVIDMAKSVLAYKTVKVPVNSAEVQIRFKRAHEIVARRRAGLDEGEALHYDGHGRYVSADDPNG